MCSAALVACGQSKQRQQEAVVDVVASGNPVFEGWYADPEGIIYGDTYWIFPTWSDVYEKQTYFILCAMPSLLCYFLSKFIVYHHAS